LIVYIALIGTQIVRDIHFVSAWASSSSIAALANVCVRDLVSGRRILQSPSQLLIASIVIPAPRCIASSYPFHITEQGMIQQSHSVPPQSQPKQGFVVPLIGFETVEVVEEVEGGIVGFVPLVKRV
jgi:hypothetical protein